MTDNSTTDQKKDEKSSSIKFAFLAYLLFLAGLFIGFTGIIGVIIAYVANVDAPDWLKTHYRYQIRTFWIGLIYALTGVATLVIWVGFVILLLTFVWYLVRCFKGISKLSGREPIPNAGTWLW